MIRHFNLLFITLLLTFAKPAICQENLFNCENSRQFANYLFNTGQFELARHEYERIGFFCPFDSTSQLNLLKSYRKLNLYNKENSFFQPKTINEISLLSPDYKLEYIRLQMVQGKYDLVQEVITNGLIFKEKDEHLLGTMLLKGNWLEAYKTSIEFKEHQSYKINALASVAAKSYTTNRKSPLLATLMSVVVPGSGKAYCGYWGDGLISFLFSASSGFFTYRAFNKYGTDKIYPWIVGGLAVSYYSSNIYGGNRAAVRYNDNLNHSFKHETEKILFADY